MDWELLLRSQQADLLKRLKASTKNLLRCDRRGYHSELTVISGKELEELRGFCWSMADKFKLKFKDRPVQDIFTKHLKGKLGEEVVANRLGNLVTEVDYEKKVGGDGKVDFRLVKATEVGIQVKSRNTKKVERAKWPISRDEINKNAVLVCVLITEIVSVEQAEYSLILAGFLPTKMIEIDDHEESTFLTIDQLLYSGGLRGYLEKLLSSTKGEKQQPAKPAIARPITVRDRQEAEKYLRLGQDFYQEQDYQKALFNYDQALQSNPRLVEVYVKRAMVKSATEDKQGAIEDCSQAIRIDSKFADAYNYRAGARRAIEDWTGAVEDYTQLISLNPNSAFAYLNRGLAYSAQKITQQALEDFQKAADFFKQENDSAYYQFALSKCRELQEALK